MKSFRKQQRKVNLVIVGLMATAPSIKRGEKMKYNEMVVSYLTVNEAGKIGDDGTRRCGIAASCSTCMYCMYPDDGEDLEVRAALERHEHLVIPYFCGITKKGESK